VSKKVDKIAEARSQYSAAQNVMDGLRKEQAALEGRIAEAHDKLFNAGQALRKVQADAT
jgi:hypothetical protein